MKDKNGIELENGHIIDLHQTVNGENRFIVIDLDSLDVRYEFDINYKYQYSVEDMLAPCKYSGEVDWEIVGSLDATEWADEVIKSPSFKVLFEKTIEL